MRKALIVLILFAATFPQSQAQRVSDFRFGGRGELVDLTAHDGGFVALVQDEGLRVIPVSPFGVAEEPRGLYLPGANGRVASMNGQPMLLWWSNGQFHLSRIVVGESLSLTQTQILGRNAAAHEVRSFSGRIGCGSARCAVSLFDAAGWLLIVSDAERVHSVQTLPAGPSAIAAHPGGFVTTSSGTATLFDLTGRQTASVPVNTFDLIAATFDGTDFVLAYRRDRSIHAATLSTAGLLGTERVVVASLGDRAGTVTPAIAWSGAEHLLVYSVPTLTAPEVRPASRVSGVRLTRELQAGEPFPIGTRPSYNESPRVAWHSGAFIAAWTHENIPEPTVARRAAQFARISPTGTIVREGILATGPLDQEDGDLVTTDEYHFVTWIEHSGGDDRSRLRLARVQRNSGVVIDRQTILLRDQYFIGDLASTSLGLDVILTWRELAAPPPAGERPEYRTRTAIVRNTGAFTIVDINGMDGVSRRAVAAIRTRFMVVGTDESSRLRAQEMTSSGAKLTEDPKVLDPNLLVSDLDATSDGDRTMVAAVSQSASNQAAFLLIFETNGDITRRELVPNATQIRLSWNGVEILVVVRDASGNLVLRRVDGGGNEVGQPTVTRSFGGADLEVDVAGGNWVIYSFNPAGEAIGVRMNAIGQLLDREPVPLGTTAALSPTGAVLTTQDIAPPPFASAAALLLHQTGPKRRTAR